MAKHIRSLSRWISKTEAFVAYKATDFGGIPVASGDLNVIVTNFVRKLRSDLKVNLLRASRISGMDDK